MNKFHLDGSEISWLVYADWLEDQDKDSCGIREFSKEPIIYNWVADSLPTDYFNLVGGRQPDWLKRNLENFALVGTTYITSIFIAGNNVGVPSEDVGFPFNAYPFYREES